MVLPQDVTDFLRLHYPVDRQAQAVRLLEGARLEDGRRPDARLLRCAAYAGQGSLERLEALVTQLAIDWRDVIVAGEYDLVGKAPVFVRDLSQPLGSSTARRPAR